MNHRHPLTLFIVKHLYGYDGQTSFSTGLMTSASFVVHMLQMHGHRAKLVEAVDGNSIDKLVTQNAPAKVILEAIWVTPAKMAQLVKLHPKVQWTVRVHSELAFLANEGNAINWLQEYLKLGVRVAFNSLQTYRDCAVLGTVDYLPNYYPLRRPRHSSSTDDRIDIGCFGAVRPLKNQLIQAIAAIEFAGKTPLYFHMNGVRVEQHGSNNLKNILALFADRKNAHLVLHSWVNHEQFLELIATMDICLQVSLSESFNIVSADAASMGRPLVGSPAISWLPKRSQADPRSVASIVAALKLADRTNVAMNSAALESYLESTVATWLAWA